MPTPIAIKGKSNGVMSVIKEPTYPSIVSMLELEKVKNV
jgi:hypothetical protein